MLSKSKMLSRFLTKNVPNPPRDFDYSPSALLSRLNSRPYQGRTTKHLNEQDDVPTTEKISLLSNLLKVDMGLECQLQDILWSAEDNVGNFEKVIYRISGAEVPAYVCNPKQPRDKEVWILCLQGHTSGMHISIGVDSATESKRIQVAGDRDIGSWCLKNGFNAICVEQLCLGERAEQKQEKIHAHPCQDMSMQLLVLGRTLMGVRVSEVLAIVKYLRQKRGPNITIGIIGNSLGGTVAKYCHALSSDILFGILSGCISEFEYSLIENSGRHCCDLYVPDLLTHFNCSDILGLAAPKLSLIVHGLGDQLFPILGFSKSYKRARAFFIEHGADDKLRPIIGLGGHRLYLNLIEAELDKQPQIVGVR